MVHYVSIRVAPMTFTGDRSPQLFGTAQRPCALTGSPIPPSHDRPTELAPYVCARVLAAFTGRDSSGVTMAGVSDRPGTRSRHFWGTRPRAPGGGHEVLAGMKSGGGQEDVAAAQQAELRAVSRARHSGATLHNWRNADGKAQGYAKLSGLVCGSKVNTSAGPRRKERIPNFDKRRTSIGPFFIQSVRMPLAPVCRHSWVLALTWIGPMLGCLRQMQRPQVSFLA